MAMAKKREIFKVDEDALKDMMASESISCGKSGADVGENVLPVTEKEKNVRATVKKQKKIITTQVCRIVQLCHLFLMVVQKLVHMDVWVTAHV